MHLLGALIPSDILVLYKSHRPYKDTLPQRLQAALGPGYQVRLVDGDHEANKRLPLIEDGVLTASTVASAKGYDAPVVFLLGVDSRRGNYTNDRALFYVGATRAKLHLVVTGVRQGVGTLLSKAELAVRLPGTSRKAAVG